MTWAMSLMPALCPSKWRGVWISDRTVTSMDWVTYTGPPAAVRLDGLNEETCWRNELADATLVRRLTLAFSGERSESAATRC